MKAKLVTYSTENLNPTQRSILSKRVNGYLDKSNNGRYKYKREGILSKIPHIKVTHKTFIVRKKDFNLVSKEIRKYGAKIKVWDIEVKEI
ncbi:MAG: hypothetical protein J7L39_02455 [Candidatus Aenigmarchaeota archaeon]|nr:hypothetical protein [Candidatus Aenigmarchaeota archaeon]